MSFGQEMRLKRELVDTPGVNSYDAYGTAKPKGLGFSSVELKSIFDKRTGTPGPNSYVVLSASCCFASLRAWQAVCGECCYIALHCHYCQCLSPPALAVPS